jgi:hypothetical protein
VGSIQGSQSSEEQSRSSESNMRTRGNRSGGLKDKHSKGFMKWFGTKVPEAQRLEFNPGHWSLKTHGRRSVIRSYNTLGDNWSRRCVGSRSPRSPRKYRSLDPVETWWTIRPSISSKVQKKNRLEELGLQNS